MYKEIDDENTIKVDFKVAYEYVGWNEIKLDKLNHPQFTQAYEINQRGITLNELHHFTPHTRHLLENGKKKLRIALYLYENYPPLLSFAKFAHADPVNNENGEEEMRYSFVFMDELRSFYLNIKQYLEKRTAEELES